MVDKVLFYRYDIEILQIYHENKHNVYVKF